MGGSFLTYSWSFFCLQLSFFAYSSPLRRLLDALSHCKQKSCNCNSVSKEAKIVSERAPIVSEETQIVNCKSKSSTVSRKLPIVSKKAASNYFDRRALWALLRAGNVGKEGQQRQIIYDFRCQMMEAFFVPHYVVGPPL